MQGSSHALVITQLVWYKEKDHPLSAHYATTQARCRLTAFALTNAKMERFLLLVDPLQVSEPIQ